MRSIGSIPHSVRVSGRCKPPWSIGRLNVAFHCREDEDSDEYNDAYSGEYSDEYSDEYSGEYSDEYSGEYSGEYSD